MGLKKALGKIISEKKKNFWKIRNEMNRILQLDKGHPQNPEVILLNGEKLDSFSSKH